jgi:hypothetical protein
MIEHDTYPPENAAIGMLSLYLLNRFVRDDQRKVGRFPKLFFI